MRPPEPTDPFTSDRPENRALSVAALIDICARYAAATATANDGYWPTAKQVAFFSLMCIGKEGVAFRQSTDLVVDTMGEALSASEMDEQSRQIAGHLDGSGGAVTSLQQDNAKEWELSRIQMEKALRRYKSDLMEDAVQESQRKLLEILRTMVSGEKIERVPDVLTLAVEHLPTHARIYRFHAPFYSYAKRIAENCLSDMLRKAFRLATKQGSIEDFEEILPAPAPIPAEDEDELFARVYQVLRLELERLLQMIQNELTPQRRNVIRYTLAARQQFWQALNILDVPPPYDLEPLPPASSDSDLAQLLNMTVNGVRVHRNHGKKTITELDAFLGLFLESLMATDTQTIPYRALLRGLLGKI